MILKRILQNPTRARYLALVTVAAISVTVIYFAVRPRHDRAFRSLPARQNPEQQISPNASVESADTDVIPRMLVGKWRPDDSFELTFSPDHKVVSRLNSAKAKIAGEDALEVGSWWITDRNKLMMQLHDKEPGKHTIIEITAQRLALKGGETWQRLDQFAGDGALETKARDILATAASAEGAASQATEASERQARKQQLYESTEKTLSRYKFDDPEIVLSKRLRAVGARAEILPNRSAVRQAWHRKDWDALIRALGRGQSLIREEQATGALFDLEGTRLYVALQTERPLPTTEHLYLIEIGDSPAGPSAIDHWPNDTWQQHPDAQGMLHEIAREASRIMILAVSAGEENTIHSFIQPAWDWNASRQSFLPPKEFELEKIKQRLNLGLISRDEALSQTIQVNRNSVRSILALADRY